MTTKYLVSPYLFFDGRCEEAIEFYKKTVGANVEMLMHYKDCPPDAAGQVAPGTKDKVMHARLTIGNSIILASDGHCNGKPKFEGFSLSLTAPTPAEAEKLFKALSDGGKVTMPMAKTFFSPAFGMLEDKFGVGWMVFVEGGAPS